MLSATYGRPAARNLATNHMARIFFAPQDLEDAREYSETLGYLTERRESRSQSHSAGRSGASSVSHSEERRALMLPQELREMDPEKEIVLLQGIKPIYTDKIRYFEDPSFTARLLPPPKVPQIDLALHQAQIAERPRQTADTAPPSATAPDRPEASREDWMQTGKIPEDRPIAELADEFFASLHLDKDLRRDASELPPDPGGEARPRRARGAAPQRKPRQR
jgi:type IV secretory pathway TraG/TraD family ATPase VirD4